jgi:hypothetical protein
MSIAREEKRLQESEAKKTFQKQAYCTTWGTTDISGFSELNVIVMDKQVADVIKALTKDTVPLREILELLDIPCKPGSNTARHKHKSSCLYKVLPKLLKLFCRQVSKDLTKKKRMPKTGAGESWEKSMLSLLVAKLTLLARGFYSTDVLSQEGDFYMSLYEHVKEDQQLMLEAVSRNITFWNDQLIIALEGYEQMRKPIPKRPLKYVSDSESDGEHEEDKTPKPPTPGGGGGVMSLQVTVRVTTMHPTQTTVTMVAARRRKMKKEVRTATLKKAWTPQTIRKTLMSLTGNVHPGNEIE